MYNNHRTYPCPYYDDSSRYYSDDGYNYENYPYPYMDNATIYNPYFYRQFTEDYFPYDDEMNYAYRSDSFEGERLVNLKDYGPQPYTVNINEATKQNDNFRTALWTGKHLQVTLMSIDVGDDIGLEIHPNVDQFIRVEEGQAIVRMGTRKDNLDFQARVSDDFAIMVPAGTWHNVINTGDTPLKVYSIYAPPQHPHGVVHVTKPSDHD
ncbi:cupin domain-containing protein [Clostridium sp. YIM B02515]|uniref:Cupin domain-containing protein n=1 Tax=Clostridium rhizosphaerae TaxID=2803861 RepID=A0ABS1T4V8_9CLOT|nr:cupin domain-containing protein [Clostridium rhizosphaerae]MBL4934360.1 cupin domain-containing protein [Clostridium rhizosphaerae]